MREWFKARNVWGGAFSALTDEEAGRLAKAIWAYTMNGEIRELDGAEKGIFAMILMTLGQDEEHDAGVSRARAIAGSRGGSQKQANAIKAQTEEAIDSNSLQLVANDSNCSNKNKNKSNSKNKEQEKELSENASFVLFWSSYPRHEGKQNALKAFMKINPDDDLLRTMLNAIEKQKASAQWKENGGQYIPHPATWLNGRRWEDEVRTDAPARAVTAHGYSQRDYAGEQEDAMRRMLEVVRA